MKILITGANGQLGSELIAMIAAGRSEIGMISDVYKEADVTGIDIEDADLSDEEAVKAYFAGKKFDLIINCAAMTNVDACESNAEAAIKGNAIVPGNLARTATDMGAKIVHISTDYVFSGNAGVPYAEWDIPNPNTAYGKSKLIGEEYIKTFCNDYFIIRTAWLYGHGGSNFVKTMLKLSESNDSIRVVNDQIGNPTNANDLSHHILKIAATNEFGLYHCTGNGICSWYEFANEIIKLSGNTCRVNSCTTEEFAAEAPRPAYSAMDNLMLRSTIGDEMRDWKTALTSYLSVGGEATLF